MSRRNEDCCCYCCCCCFLERNTQCDKFYNFLVVLVSTINCVLQQFYRNLYLRLPPFEGLYHWHISLINSISKANKRTGTGKCGRQPTTQNNKLLALLSDSFMISSLAYVTITGKAAVCHNIVRTECIGIDTICLETNHDVLWH